MSKSFREKLTQFVEAEKQAGIDQKLLDQLRAFMVEDLLYFDEAPIRRNTLNVFFKEIHSLMEQELLTGKYGASAVIDSIIVTTFEIGYKQGIAESGVEQ